MSQEIAHSYGLDHELLASDPMTYLGYTGERAFQDQTVSCGEFSPRSCGISGIVCRPNQNSVQLLYQRVGKYGDDTDAPAITVNQPSDGDVVSPSFDIVATASDNRIVTSATIAIDGLTVATLPGAGPFELTTDPLTTGEHVIVVEASDGTNLGMVSRTVMVKGSNDSELSRMFGGCSVGGGDGGWLIGLAAFVLARRRR